MEPAKRQARRLSDIHKLIKQFSTALEVDPFDSKRDQAKVNGLINDIRKVLGGEVLPKQPVQYTYYEPEQVEPQDPALAMEWIDKIRKEKRGTIE
tara:strand:+ start:314 stop:598 length:285 start_codon:yes stop_codon:yes gene_type:complete